MRPQNSPPLLQCFIISSIFFLFIVFPGTHCSNIQQQYTDCQSSFACGKLKEISYPFWRNEQSHCGRQGFQLQCQPNQYPVIDINNQSFLVLEIEQNSHRIKLARSDFWDDACPIANSSLNHVLFSYHATSNRNLSIYGCLQESSSSGPVYQFPCTTKDGITYHYLAGELSTDSENLCEFQFTVPVLLTAYNQLINGTLTLKEALNKGFVAHYNYDNKEFCKLCRTSGGKCALDYSICICHNGASQLPPCPIHPRDYIQWTAAKVIGIGFAIGAAFTCAIIFCYKTVILVSGMINRELKKDANVETCIKKYGSLAPKRYHCSDIKRITNSFREKLGEGGFCSVYKGKLEDGRLVAVKVVKIDSSKTNGEEFINEVISISRTSHVNIVSLLGYCYTERRRALIFEFMPNGSLEKFIHNENISTAGHLPWEKLHQIAIGIALGLEYLHRGCNTRILHFDIKPHNILLDEDFCPKISDFGLAKLCSKDSVITMMDARGTVGYIAPEVFSRNFGRVSHKSDVYSFGMMILEMVGGRKNTNIAAANSSEIYYPHWVYDRLQQGNNLGLHGVTTSQDNTIAKKMIIIGLWCIQTYPVHRPSMNEVLIMLEGSLDALKIPPKPFIYTPSRS
ncbi:hypothetical protein DITRI_Ditri04bG0198300 [Diplodiscus trichospermus]